MKLEPPKLEQPEDDYRYATDAWLLASFAARFSATSFVDLGTGCGVIAYALAKLLPGSQGIAVERRALLADYARRNLRGLPVTTVQADLRHLQWQPECFDLVTCNPPYFEVGTGKINKNPGIAEARHTFFGDIQHFAAHLRSSLRPNGHFCYIFPFRLYEGSLKRLLKSGWWLREKLIVRSFAEREPKLVCIALSKRVCETLERELVLYRAHREYTDETATILQAMCARA